MVIPPRKRYVLSRIRPRRCFFRVFRKRQRRIPQLTLSQSGSDLPQTSRSSGDSDLKGRGGFLTTVILMIVILLGFAGSPTWAQPPQWVDINQTVFNLNSIFVLSPTVGWAVGDTGTILHWNGVEWTLVQSPTILNLYSVSFPDPSNPNDGWIVGQLDGVTGFPAILGV